jgi:hypothetical protein
VLSLVHCCGIAGAARAQAPPRAAEQAAALPAKVQEMRAMLLAAARSGNVDELRTPLEWNEIKPSAGRDDGTDPIAAWRRLSGDGEGLEVLAAVVEILEMPYARTTGASAPTRAKGGRGKAAEPPALFVWPYLAERPLGALTQAELVDLYRLVPAAEAKAMIAAGRYTFWRLVIGADGTWHALVKGE